MIRSATPGDAKAICDIYNVHVLTTIATFEETPVSEAEMSSRIAETQKSLPWLVLEEEGRVVGYAYARPWRARSAYRFTVESSICLASDLHGRGSGTLLYRELLAQLAARERHRVIGVIALPNDASVKLHERLGFRQVGIFTQVGRKFDRWIDVAFWEIALPPTT